MRSKLLRLFVVVLAGVYIFWLLQREYRHKYLFAGALNAAVWRSLNATTPELLKNLPALEDAKLGISRDRPRCAIPAYKLEFPATCNFFGGNFGGKSRNCRFWWLGRQCRIFFVPEAVYAKAYMKQRLDHAFTRPCRVLFAGQAKPGDHSSFGSYDDMLNSFNCRGPLASLPFEIRLHIIADDGSIRIKQYQKL